MPTGTCKYPHHHTGGPSAGAPTGLIAAIVAGAIVIYEWHVVVVVLAVVVALAVAAGAMVLLWHSHHAEPYDAAWSGEDLDEVPAVRYSADVRLQARVGQLERQLVEAQERPAITTSPRTVHQHQHLHINVSREQLAELGNNVEGHHARKVLPQRYPAVTAEVEDD